MVTKILDFVRRNKKSIIAVLALVGSMAAFSPDLTDIMREACAQVELKQ